MNVNYLTEADQTYGIQQESTLNLQTHFVDLQSQLLSQLQLLHLQADKNSGYKKLGDDPWTVELQND